MSGEEEHKPSRTLNIAGNCAAAMRSLRSPTEERTLWIDSICIDQTSLDERSSQVALMGEVYRDAARVVVWLGEKDAAAETAMRLLEEIGDVDSVRREMGLEGRPRSEDAAALDVVAALKARLHAQARELTADATTAEKDKIGPLFRRSWFSRMWTIQEVTFPQPPNVVVQCGDIALPWLHLYMAVDILGAIKYRWGGWEDSMRLQTHLVESMMLHRVPGARALMDQVRPARSVRGLTLALVLIRCREKAATDPKDKVYALYGLLQDMKVDGLSLPDYRRELADIYAEVTAASIRFDKSLFVLSYVASDRRREDLSSWVPDWSDRGWKESDVRYPVVRDRFAAAGGAEAKWEFPPGRPKEMVVYGMIVDEVIYRGGSYPRVPTAQSTDELQDFHRVYETMREWVDISSWTGGSPYPTGERVEDALRTTLMNDEPENNGDAAAMQSYAAWLEIMRTGVKPSSHLQAQGSVSVEMETLIGITRSPAWQFHNLAMVFSVNKTFFRTGEGYFGTAPDGFPDPIRSDDVVAVVAGMAMPVVLRPVDSGRFRLISHCYLHGIMYGEEWERRGGDGREIILV